MLDQQLADLLVQGSSLVVSRADDQRLLPEFLAFQIVGRDAVVALFNVRYFANPVLLVQQGQPHNILVARDFTDVQIQHARSYQAGDVIHFNRAHKKQGIARDSYLTVESVDRRDYLLTIRTDDGRRLEVSPARWKSAQVYQWEQREVAAGDRIQFRIHDKKNKVANNEFATVLALEGDRARLRIEGKDQRILTIPLAGLRHIDYGYASTSHSSQGATVDRAIINTDSMRSRLVNREQFYVSVSRARKDVHVYTDDIKALRLAVGKERKKEIALEALKPQQAQTQSAGLRI